MYELVAGERRWRAAQQAQLHEIPALVRELADRETLEVALVENLQRQDLTAVEEARGYQRMMEEFRRTQEDVAEVVGKSRSHVANTLRLLTLPMPVQEMVDDISRTERYRPSVPYGLGVQLIDIDGQPTLGHSGRLLGFRSAVRYLPDSGLTVAVLSNQSRTDPAIVVRQLLTIALDTDRPGDRTGRR